MRSIHLGTMVLHIILRFSFLQNRESIFFVQDVAYIILQFDETSFCIQFNVEFVNKITNLSPVKKCTLKKRLAFSKGYIHTVVI